MRIYLVGMPGCGKTSIAKKLAKKLKSNFYDLDNMIEDRIGVSISEHFDGFGEKNFRLIEQEILHKTFNFDNAVIATGGGTACFFNNISEINKHGISIYLEASVKLIKSRLNIAEQEKRPLIKNKKDIEELQTYLELLLEQRISFYKKAHITFSALNVNINKLAEVLLKLGMK